MERPRNPEHGDYASNARPAARQEGRRRRRASWPRRSPSELGRAAGHQVGRGRRAGLPQHPPRRGRRGRAGPRRGRRPAQEYGRSDRARRAEDQPGVRLGQPDRPGAPRRRPVGRGRRRAGAGCCAAAGAEVDHASTTSTTPAPRSTGSPRRCYAAAKGEPAPEDGYGGAYIAEIASAVARRAPGRARAGRRRGAGGVPGRGRRADVRRDQAVAGPSSACTSTSGSPRRTCTTAASCEHALDGCASRATSTRPTARSGCAPPTSATTRTGCSSAATARRPTSPPTAPTTSTSASAASTGALHARRRPPRLRRPAARRWPPASATTRTRNLEILIGQLVNLVRDGEPVRMRKRAGTVITLEDLVDAVGVDAARYALARYSTDSPIDIDIDAVDPGQPATTRSTTCSTSHARTPRVPRNAAELGLTRGDGDFDPALLEPREGERPAQGARRVPGGGGHARPSCASRTGSPATWRSWPATYHRFYDNVPGRCRTGDEAITDLTPGPAVAERRHPHGDRQRAGPARRLRARADVAHAGTRGRGAARRPRAAGGRPGCVPPRTSTRCVPQLWPRTVTRGATTGR